MRLLNKAMAGMTHERDVRVAESLLDTPLQSDLVGAGPDDPRWPPIPKQGYDVLVPAAQKVSGSIDRPVVDLGF